MKSCKWSCKGSKCLWECPERWRSSSSDNSETLAVPHLYSTWVQPSILAGSRPAESMLKGSASLITRFKTEAIGAVFNIQEPGEHAQCGPGLETPTGFSYNPETIMASGLSYYNFPLSETELPSFSTMIAIHQHMELHLRDHGHKVFVHGHSGLGRTGLVVAAYLIYSQGLAPKEASKAIQSKRPGSIGAKGRFKFLERYAEHLKKIRLVIPLDVDVVDEVAPALVTISSARGRPSEANLSMSPSTRGRATSTLGRAPSVLNRSTSLRAGAAGAQSLARAKSVSQKNTLLGASMIANAGNASSAWRTPSKVGNLTTKDDKLLEARTVQSAWAGRTIARSKEFSLDAILERQNLILHGEEAARLRYVPKVLHELCGALRRVSMNRSATKLGGEMFLGKVTPSEIDTMTEVANELNKGNYAILDDPMVSEKVLMSLLVRWLAVLSKPLIPNTMLVAASSAVSGLAVKRSSTAGRASLSAFPEGMTAMDQELELALQYPRKVSVSFDGSNPGGTLAPSASTLSVQSMSSAISRKSAILGSRKIIDGERLSTPAQEQILALFDELPPDVKGVLIVIFDMLADLVESIDKTVYSVMVVCQLIYPLFNLDAMTKSVLSDSSGDMSHANAKDWHRISSCHRDLSLRVSQVFLDHVAGVYDPMFDYTTQSSAAIRFRQGRRLATRRASQSGSRASFSQRRSSGLLPGTVAVPGPRADSPTGRRASSRSVIAPLGARSQGQIMPTSSSRASIHSAQSSSSGASQSVTSLITEPSRPVPGSVAAIKGPKAHALAGGVPTSIVSFQSLDSSNSDKSGVSSASHLTSFSPHLVTRAVTVDSTSPVAQIN